MTHDVVRSDTSLSARIAESMRIERARRKISGRELSRQCDKGPNWINTRENGERPISVDDAQLIADALGMKLVDLMGIDGATPLPPALQEVMDIIADDTVPDVEKRKLLTIHRYATATWREMRSPTPDPEIRRAR